MSTFTRCCGRLADAGGALLTALRRHPTGPPTPHADRVNRGVALTGWIWPGGDSTAFHGTVVIDHAGVIVALGPDVAVPEGIRPLHAGWIGPGVIDAHVHLAFGTPAANLGGGLVAVRDLGAPLDRARRWQTAIGGDAAPAVAVAGPLLTGADGYPSDSWGADGFSVFLAQPAAIRALLAELARDGVDLIKIALEPGGGRPVPTPDQVRTVVGAAHDAGLAVTAHALSLDMVTRALDAGVDELAHIPVDVLPPELVERIADLNIPVVSTLQTFYTGGIGRGPGLNATALHQAGVRLLYGTDLGNVGTRPGVDPRELDRLADAGLGRTGALRAATEGAAAAAGLNGRGGSGLLTVGTAARLVGLAADPLIEPAAWRSPLAVVVGDRLLLTPPDIDAPARRRTVSA